MNIYIPFVGEPYVRGDHVRCGLTRRSWFFKGNPFDGYAECFTWCNNRDYCAGFLIALFNHLCVFVDLNVNSDCQNNFYYNDGDSPMYFKRGKNIISIK